MNKIILSLLCVASLTGIGCHQPSLEKNLSQPNEIDPLSSQMGPQNFLPNGKSQTSPLHSELYTHQALSAAHFPEMTKEMNMALEQQKNLLKYKKRKIPQKVGNLTVTNEQLQKTADILLKAKDSDLSETIHQLDAYKIKGQDQRGNVHFTGYYTPVLPVSRIKTKKFQFPIYAYPQDWQGALPTRKDIDGDLVLKGRNLELAYAENLIDIYIMQVQGSGIVEYGDGTQELFAYTGTNRKSYSSIGNYMVRNELTTSSHVSLQFIKKYLHNHPEKMDEILFSNASYVFFKPVDSNPKGAGLVPLTKLHSIAVDTRYIPMGSILLASIPIVNGKNQVISHEYRLVVAQDIGGAIKGPGHIDLYTGVGYESQRHANRLHHYGNLWLLLPNEDDNSALALK
jgi:Membrane-bound lytic murein transglycosylase